MKLNRMARVLLAALCVFLLTLFFFSVWKILSIMRDYKTAERRYSALSDSVVSAQAPAQPAPTPAPETEGSDQAGSEAETSMRERSPVSVDFAELGKLCGDVVGWLYLPNTPINYPLVQGQDNSYYLHRFLDGSENGGGTLFVDFVCPSDFSGRNTIIYGHNMRDGSMFALIDDYADVRFYEQHPVMYLNTPKQNYRIEFFSGFTTDPESFVYSVDFASENDYVAFLNSLLASSEIRCGTTVSSSDRVVTLSTCTYSGEDVRFVLCGKLVEID